MFRSLMARWAGAKSRQCGTMSAGSIGLRDDGLIPLQ
jgi:hypothetical protein